MTATDAAALASELSKVKSLIKQVGSHPAIQLKEASLLFDLGGNVAEYYVHGGELKTYDYSGYDFVDPYDKEVRVGEASRIGFRVVKE